MPDTRTLADMADRIASELARDDLSSTGDDVATTRNAIRDAVLFYQRHHFFFNEEIDDSIVLVGGQTEYDPPDDMISILQVSLTTPGNTFTLEYVDYQVIDTWDASRPPVQAEPAFWSFFRGKIRLYPTPSSGVVYGLHILYSKEVPFPATDATSNFWMTKAEELIRHRAKYVLHTGVIRDKDAAQLDRQLEIEAFKNIYREYIEKANISRIVAREY